MQKQLNYYGSPASSHAQQMYIFKDMGSKKKSAEFRNSENADAMFESRSVMKSQVLIHSLNSTQLLHTAHYS